VVLTGTVNSSSAVVQSRYSEEQGCKRDAYDYGSRIFTGTYIDKSLYRMPGR
jgi:hypothetical protein